MGLIGKALDIFVAYRFLRLLTEPFEKTDAYKLGIIDANGNILRKRSDLKTSEEKSAYTLTHRIVWKIKQMLQSLPYGKTKIASYASALWFLREEYNFSEQQLTTIERHFAEHLDKDYTPDFSEYLIEECLTASEYVAIETIKLPNDTILVKRGESLLLDESRELVEVLGTFLVPCMRRGGIRVHVPVQTLVPVNSMLVEDAPTNSVGDGSAGVALYDAPMSQVQRRVRPKEFFAGYPVFEVPPDEYHKSIRGKHPRHRYSHYVGERRTGKRISKYAKQNPGRGIIIKNSNSGEMTFIRQGKKLDD